MPENETTTDVPGTISDMPKLEEVAVGSALVTGAVFVAPTSVALPTDAVTDLNEAYKVLSFTSVDGIRITESSSKKELRIWEALALTRTVMTDRVEQLKFKPVNTNARVAKATWGDDAVKVDTTTGALDIGHHGNPVDPIHIVIEYVPFAGAVTRLCCKGQVTERGEVALNGQDSTGRDLTFDCLVLDDGMTMHEYVAYTD